MNDDVPLGLLLGLLIVLLFFSAFFSGTETALMRLKSVPVEVPCPLGSPSSPARGNNATAPGSPDWAHPFGE